MIYQRSIEGYLQKGGCFMYSYELNRDIMRLVCDRSQLEMYEEVKDLECWNKKEFELSDMKLFEVI